ncbi:MAG: thioredoxin fold domain-containing protein, partial [Sulfuricellaceae bacterium]|nr:thioredoxin fold domain-containing protein [Sulfuricellaceae bacterium]
MKYWIALFLLFASWSGHAAEASTAPAEPGALATETPGWFKNSFLDLREDLADARQHGKRLMIFFHQDGCPYCKELVQVNFSDKAIADKTQRYFDSIALNMWGDREVTWIDGKTYSEKQFAALLRVHGLGTPAPLPPAAAAALVVAKGVDHEAKPTAAPAIPAASAPAQAAPGPSPA